MCATSGRSQSGLSSYFHLCLLCFLVCVHHGHQAENLTKDVTKTGNNGSLSMTVDSLPVDSPDEHLTSQQLEERQLECLELMKSMTFKEIHSEDEDHHPPIRDYRLWLSASVSILIISLCGIFGVMVIPLMQKVFYQHLIQFLVALAIGSMLGDAFLHLIPHAFSIRSHKEHHDPHTHDHHEQEHETSSHTSHVWIGFVGLIALILFFLIEKSINMFGEWREHHREINRERKVRIVRTGHKASSRAVGERLCKHKYSAYCVSDIDDVAQESFNPQEIEVANHDVEMLTVDTKMNVGKSSLSPLIGVESDGKETFTITKNLPSVSFTKQSGAEQALLPTISDSCPVENKRDSTACDGVAPERTACQEWWSPDTGVTDPANSSQYDTVFIREHEHSHHGHSHAHSHLHSAPDSIGSVAWMVIVGDGIHNLADGLAVGAAFTEDFMSGLSTSIAVLCHELPHEVGDFAMLLKAGMSIKQAIFYNILSSFLAFLGMIIGVVLGNVEHLTPWVFMGTAGIFMYVALVDMMPELNSGHAHPYTSHEQHEARSLELASQVLGLATGISIMLLIALYEHDLRDIFVSFNN